MELTRRRSTDEILQALADGQLDTNDLKIAEVAMIEKVDKSGDVPKLVETVTVTKVAGRDADVHVVKH